MKDQSKIQLSALEQELVKGTDWILTKNGIIEKVKGMLTSIQEKIAVSLEVYRDKMPAELTTLTPKISKGENYMGLPWLMLDYPRYFNRKDIFAIRSFFWWGNFFSITLHLSGHYKSMFADRIMASYPLLKEKGFSICMNEEPWEHHFEASNYQAVSGMTRDEMAAGIQRNSFIKLAKKFSLDQWNEVVEILSSDFKQLMEILKG